MFRFFSSLLSQVGRHHLRNSLGHVDSLWLVLAMIPVAVVSVKFGGGMGDSDAVDSIRVNVAETYHGRTEQSHILGYFSEGTLSQGLSTSFLGRMERGWETES